MEAAQLMANAISAVCVVAVAISMMVLAFRVGRRAVNNL